MEDGQYAGAMKRAVVDGTQDELMCFAVSGVVIRLGRSKTVFTIE